MTQPSSPLPGKGDSARAALIAAGVELFGEYGPNGTSTRMLVRRAAVNISAISYYFGSKEALYHAVIGHIAEGMSERTGHIRRQATCVLAAAPLSRDQALDALHGMLSGFAELFIDVGPTMRLWFKLVVREQTTPSAAFELLYDGYLKHMLGLLVRLVAAATGLDEHGCEVRVRALALVGQILGFFVGREALLRQLGVKNLTHDHMALIQSVLRSHAAACLQTPQSGAAVLPARLSASAFPPAALPMEKQP